MIRLSVLLLVFSMACQTGKIPCPKVKYVKARKTVIRKNFVQSEQSLSARAAEAEKEKTQGRGTRAADTRMIHNVSVEEWDCPHPGAKKYMPKSVKDNIRRNMKKIKQDKDDTRSDSVSVRQRR